MADYKKLYIRFFNKMTDIINDLVKLQQDMEEEIISSDHNLIVLKTENEPAFKSIKFIQKKSGIT